MTAVKPIGQTDPIPNDTVSVRNGSGRQPGQAYCAMVCCTCRARPMARRRCATCTASTVSAPADDKDYDSIRTAAKALNLDLEQQIAPPKPKT